MSSGAIAFSRKRLYGVGVEESVKAYGVQAGVSALEAWKPR
jgi:hypothetical protein